MCVSPATPRCKNALRPDSCHVCGAPAWWNGARVVTEVLYDLAQGTRRMIDVLRRRARCSDRTCPAGSWTIYPPGAYPHRSYQLCVVAAAVTEVCFAGRSRQAVAIRHDCSRRSVSRWIRWAAALAHPADLTRLCARLDPAGLPPPPPVTAGGGPVRRAGSVLRLLDHLGDLLRRRGVGLPGRGPGLLGILTAQRARFGDVCWLTRSSPPLRVAPEDLPL